MAVHTGWRDHISPILKRLHWGAVTWHAWKVSVYTLCSLLEARLQAESCFIGHYTLLTERPVLPAISKAILCPFNYCVVQKYCYGSEFHALAWTIFHGENSLLLVGDVTNRDPACCRMNRLIFRWGGSHCWQDWFCGILGTFSSWTYFPTWYKYVMKDQHCTVVSTGATARHPSFISDPAKVTRCFSSGFSLAVTICL